MAKRNRLTPANPDLTASDVPASKPSTMLRAPIADVVSDASRNAALEEMNAVMTQARRGGQLVISLPLAQIDTNHLVRDRMVVNDAEMKVLKASLRARGQQTPIEVVDLGGDQYGLISGWRRCQALGTLHKEGQGDGTVLALLRRPQLASDAYIAMVEENEIRVGLSYFERARIAARATQQGVFETQKQALLQLYASASRAKRSKIRSFLTVVAHLDGTVKFPGAIGERLGLQLSQRLDQDQDFAASLVARLKKAAPQDAGAEQKLLISALIKRGAEKSEARSYRDHALGRGVIARTHEDGRIELRGAPVPAEVCSELLHWLSNRLS